MKRLVDRVFDNETGRLYSAGELLDNKSEKEIFDLRRELEIILREHGIPKLSCPYCKSKLYLRGNIEKVHFFSHYKINPDCPLENFTHISEEQLRAYIYHGVKEGPYHRKIKERLYHALSLDNNRFKNILVEKTIKDETGWRKPDIQFDFNDRKMVFEIQISNTFLSVIVSRELFYGHNDIPLIWICGDFDRMDSHFFEKDILYHHNGNLFVFDDEAYNASIEQKQLIIKAYYLIPQYQNENVFPLWCNKPELINFDKVKFDKDTDGCFRAYYKDYGQHTDFMENKKCLFEFIISQENQRIYDDEIKPYLNNFNSKYFGTWENYHDICRIRLLLCAFLSIRDETVYGYRFDNVKSLIHLIRNEYNDIFWLVIAYLKTGDNMKRIAAIDNKNTIIKAINYELKENKKNETKYNKLLTYLFDELIL
jgi:hypothetical protein